MTDNPTEPFQPCVDMIRAVDNFQTFQQNAIAQLNTSLFDLSSLNGTSAIFSTLATVALWRMAGDSANVYSSDIGNAPVVSQLGEILQITYDILNKSTTGPNFPWSAWITNLLSTALAGRRDAVLAKVNNISPDDAIYAVDETLRRLAGYMKIAGIQFDVQPKFMIANTASVPVRLLGDKQSSRFYTERANLRINRGWTKDALIEIDQGLKVNPKRTCAVAP